MWQAFKLVQLRRLYSYIRHHSVVIFVVGFLAGWFPGKIADYYWTQGNIEPLLEFVVILLVALALYYLLRHWLAPSEVPLGKPPQPHRGLILILGREPTALKAIEFHGEKLKYVWFLVTDQSLQIFNQLKLKLDSNLTTRTVFIEKIYDPESTALALKQTIEQAEQNFTLAKQELICDVTGGTVVMTMGAITQCRRSGILAQIVPATYDSQMGNPIPQTPIEVPLTD